MRYLLGILATIGLIVLILVLLLRGGGSTPEVKPLKLSDYATSNSSVHYIIDGPIVADQDHDQINIDVDANQVTFTLYQGYEGDVVKQQSYPNNQDAYTVFLKALQQEGFTKGNNDKALSDERGRCPLGQRRIYSFTDGSDQLMRYWSTSCGDKTFGGETGKIDALFRRQVPDFGKLVSGSQFNSMF